MRHLSLKLFALTCLVVGFWIGKSVGKTEIRTLHSIETPCSHFKG